MRGGIRGCGTGADELRIIRATRSLAITIKRIALRVETILLEILVRPRMTRLRAIRRAVLIRAANSYIQVPVIIIIAYAHTGSTNTPAREHIDSSRKCSAAVIVNPVQICLNTRIDCCTSSGKSRV